MGKFNIVAGEQDFLKPYGLELVESCVDPVIINHPKGHTIPRLGISLVNLLSLPPSLTYPIIDLLMETYYRWKRFGDHGKLHREDSKDVARERRKVAILRLLAQENNMI